MNLLRKIKVITVPLYLSILIIFASAIVTTEIMFSIQSVGLYGLFSIFNQSIFLLPLLNLIPVLLAMLFMFFATGNTVISVGLVAFVGSFLSLINRFKIIYRDDPLFHYDIALVPELMGVIRGFGVGLLAMVVSAMLVFILLVCVMLRLVKTQKFAYKARIIGCVIVLFFIFIVNGKVYGNDEIFHGLPVHGSIYNDKDVFNSRGFLYSFIYNLNTSRIVRPENYNRHDIEKILESRESDTVKLMSEQMPHIIIIMSEAFADFSDNEHFNFDGFIDPFENYRNIIGESVHGRAIVPGLGGGTADTEFELLTGINSRFFRGVPYAYRVISKDMEALPRLLRNIGYSTVAIHPFAAWFYNRHNVYEFIGFDDFIDISRFDSDAEKKAGFITDAVCFDKIIEVFENREPDKPMFSFTVTIQNHGPFENKFNTFEKNFNTDLDLTLQEINALSNYFVGVADNDIELKRLVDYFSGQSEPVVMLFFGDHAPAFSDGLYDKIFGSFDRESIESLSSYYGVPYFIWWNDASGNLAELGERPIMSVYNLGAKLLEMIGYEGLSTFFDYLNETRDEFPVVLQHDYLDSEGMFSSIEGEEQLQLLHKLNYYFLID